MTDINLFLDTISRTSLQTIKRILSAQSGYRENKGAKHVDDNLEAYKDVSSTALEILKNCNLMRYLCQKAVKTSYLTHFERLSILYVFGHLGEDGHAFAHKVMSYTLNYQYNTTEKFIRKCPEKPISCVKLRDQYKKATELSIKILSYKKQKRSIDSNIRKIEKELSMIYDDAGVDVLEIEMGLLMRRKKDEWYEWVIEL